jgi:sulfatase modifying factor 1
LTVSAMSQRTMITHKHDGTKEYSRLSAVDSVTFEPFISVAGGTFTAGSTSTTISSFSIDKYEVTYELWTAVRSWALTNGYTDLVAGQNGYNPVGSNNPVTEVNWYDIVKWCNARSEKDGLTPVYYTDGTQSTVYRAGDLDINIDAVKWTVNGYRLPTEAEWEFAAKGGTLAQQPTSYTFSGSNTIGDVAWYYDNSGINTHPVGGLAANELGLYDMSGNVYEWCWDWYGSVYPSGETTDPKGPTTTQAWRLLRGGSFSAGENNCRVFNRTYYDPTNRNYNNGFRCVQD